MLVVVALFEIISIARAGGDTGSDEQWQAAAERVRAEWRVGDLVVFAPDWVDPVGRLVLGELLSIEDAARMDGAKYTVVWELSIRGARAKETLGRTLESSFSEGPISIKKWVGEPLVVTADFRELIASAQISGDSVGRPRVSLEEVGFEPHRCVLAIPKPGAAMSILFPEVELGSTLVGYVGIADVFTRRDVRDPARLELVVDGVAVADVTVGVEDGWVRFEAATRPKTSNVQIRIGSAAKNRRVCFAAEARR